MNKFEKRINKILRQCIEQFNLNLEGLVVFTEAATGHYLHTPILAALAGAKKVYAIAADSRYGSKEQVKEQTMEAACRWETDKKIEVVFDKNEKHVADSDIITNSGFVRPINREMISWMKPTAVVPLMWETWEFRDDDLDLDACRKKEILVLGTNEHAPPCDMAPYSGFMGMKLLFDLGLEGYHTKILLLGGQPTLGGAIYKHLTSVGCEVSWYASNTGNTAIEYEALNLNFEASGADYDALLIAEHIDKRCLIGKEGFISFERIADLNPNIRIGHIAGHVDIHALETSGLFYLPEEVRPFGYMSYQPDALGPLPILELYAAGLKVGEAMARSRLSGATITEAISRALGHSPAMDFEGNQA